MSKKEIILNYYRAMAEKQRDILVEDLEFRSSYANYNNRDAMLDEIWPSLGKNKAENIRVLCESDICFARYSLSIKEKQIINTELFQFNDTGQISKIEVFRGSNN